ncbi:MAG: DUF547 domain-containing protein [Planctomycetota bacterium]
MNVTSALASRCTGVAFAALLVLLPAVTGGCGGGATVVNNDTNPPVNNTNTGNTNHDTTPGNNTDVTPGNNTSTANQAPADLRERADAALSAAEALVAAGDFAAAAAAFDALIAEFGNDVPDIAEMAATQRQAAHDTAETAAQQAYDALHARILELPEPAEGEPPLFVAVEAILAEWPAALANTDVAQTQLMNLRGEYASARERWMVEWTRRFDPLLIARDYDSARRMLDDAAGVLTTAASQREFDRVERAMAANAQLDAAVMAVAAGSFGAAVELLDSALHTEAWSDLPLRVLVPRVQADGTQALEEMRPDEYRSEIVDTHMTAAVDAALQDLATALDTTLAADPPQTRALQATLDGFAPALRSADTVAEKLADAQAQLDARELAYLEDLAQVRLPKWMQTGNYPAAREAIAAAREALRPAAGPGLELVLAMVEKAAAEDSGAAARLYQSEAERDMKHAEDLVAMADYAAAIALFQQLADNADYREYAPDAVAAARARIDDCVTTAEQEAIAWIAKIRLEVAVPEPDFGAALSKAGRVPQRLLVSDMVQQKIKELQTGLKAALQGAIDAAIDTATGLAAEYYFADARAALLVRARMPADAARPLAELDDRIANEAAEFIRRAGREPERPAEDAGRHAPFDRLLRTYVDADGRVNYAAIAAAGDLLAAYLKVLATTDPAALGRSDRLAFWINAYNAFTIELVIHHTDWPKLSSLRDVPDAWKRVAWTINGKPYSLDQIENEQIRPAFNDPRVHAALVCAARGCPALQAGAYVGPRLDSQLTEAMRRFVADETRGAAFVRTRAGSELRLSKVFEWYADDFGGNLQTTVQWVLPYLPESVRLAIRSEGADSVIVSWIEYDWSLNGK